MACWQRREYSLSALCTVALFCTACSGIDDLRFGGRTFNGLHSGGSIGKSDSYGLIIQGRGKDPRMFVSTVTHEEGHGLGMSHDNKGAHSLRVRATLTHSSSVFTK